MATNIVVIDCFYFSAIIYISQWDVPHKGQDCWHSSMLEKQM